MCCGFWAIQNLVIHKVEDECDEHNLQQVKHVAGLVNPHMEKHCIAYENGSFACRMLVIMPIAFILIFVLTIIAVCVCSCVSFYKWGAVRRKYQKAVNYRIANELQTKNNLAKAKFLNEDP